MKSLFVAVASLVVLTQSVSAHAEYRPGQILTVANCYQAVPGLADAGYNVQIQKGGLADKTLAIVTESTIAGSRHFETVLVNGPLRRMNGESYLAKNFSLSISFRPATNNGYAGHLTMQGMGYKIDQPVRCFYPVHTM